MRSSVGVIHGRFQPLHLGHMEYLLAAFERSQFVYVCITNPDPGTHVTHPSDPARTDLSSNPFTFYERLAMVRDAVTDEGISRERFEIVPLPISNPELWQFYVPLDATFYITIYDDWGRHKLEKFHELGLNAELLWERSPDEKLYSGTDIRQRIKDGLAVDDQLPPAVTKLITDWNLADRLTAS